MAFQTSHVLIEHGMPAVWALALSAAHPDMLAIVGEEGCLRGAFTTQWTRGGLET